MSPSYIMYVLLPFGQATKLNGGKSSSQLINVVKDADTAHREVEGHELSLSLTLPNPSSNASSSASEISEAFSSFPVGFSNYKDFSSLSNLKERINLDLSLAICGN